MVKYKRIGLFVGHSILANGTCTSADGRKNGGKLEYAICKELATEMKKWFDKIEQPCDVIIVPEKKYKSGYEDDYKLPIANSGKYDLIIELHLNSFDGTATGSEVLYISNDGKVVAQRIQNKLKTIFDDRKVKHRDNLYMLTKTKPVSVMIESFFCDNKTDCDKFDKLGKAEVARRLVEGVCDTSIPTQSKTETYYRVVIGSYKDRDNAIEVMEQAKTKGFSGAFLTTFEKEVG